MRVRVNHRARPGPDCFSSSLLRFRGRTRVEIAIGVAPVQIEAELQEIVYFCGTFAGARLRDKARLSGVISCTRLYGGNSGFGELLHR